MRSYLAASAAGLAVCLAAQASAQTGSCREGQACYVDPDVVAKQKAVEAKQARLNAMRKDFANKFYRYRKNVADGPRDDKAAWRQRNLALFRENIAGLRTLEGQAAQIDALHRSLGYQSSGGGHSARLRATLDIYEEMIADEQRLIAMEKARAKPVKLAFRREKPEAVRKAQAVKETERDQNVEINREDGVWLLRRGPNTKQLDWASKYESLEYADGLIRASIDPKSVRKGPEISTRRVFGSGCSARGRKKTYRVEWVSYEEPTRWYTEDGEFVRNGKPRAYITSQFERGWGFFITLTPNDNDSCVLETQAALKAEARRLKNQGYSVWLNPPNPKDKSF